MKQRKLILAIESSCDDTSIAIISTNYEVISLLTSTQIDHDKYGGILPELASRLHIRNILYLLEHIFNVTNLEIEQIDAIAVSINPGLIGSLLVGLSIAKSISWSMEKPLITVNHMLGHIFANHLEYQDITPPFLALVVSGGHTELVLFETNVNYTIVGKTLDDAAGETFDKAAKLMHLGFPGGPIIDKLASQTNDSIFDFPVGLNRKDNFNFSYSGLKTAIKQYISSKSETWIDKNKARLANSIQTSIVKPLVNKTISYAKKHNIKTILVGGGVAANTLLRTSLLHEAAIINAKAYFPSLKYCLDNAAMIGAAAIPKYEKKLFSSLDINAFSDKGLRII